MNIFLDTSSLFKLYHNEVGSEIIEQVFAHNSVSAIYLSKISKVEFASAAWKKVRTNDISKTDASQLLFLFEADFEKYFFFEIEDAIIEKSAQLISIYGMEGLRTLDSIQLATAVIFKNQIDLNVTSDSLFKKFMANEKLKIY